MTEIHGSCDDRFASVREAFTTNFEEGLDVGASVAVTVDGEMVMSTRSAPLRGSATRSSTSGRRRRR